MKTDGIREQLDLIIDETIDFDQRKIPSILFDDLEKWKWGYYGWTSPASLIITSTWVKHFIPSQDCCKIWARDEKNIHINGGYSIRTVDEKITIPLFSKHDLCRGFCSDNSGMQGSRAIEKMRNIKRLNVNFFYNQRTIFDLSLFASIFNKINNLNVEQSLETLRYLIFKAKKFRSDRDLMNSSIRNIDTNIDLLEVLTKTSDPELVKCIAASCLQVIYSTNNFSLKGVEDFKTSSDMSAKKAGDLQLINLKGEVMVAIEVKGESIQIDWQNINRAEKIINEYPTIQNFIFVHENRSFCTDPNFKEIISSNKLKTHNGVKITFFSIHDLYRLALSFTDLKSLLKLTGKNISIAPSIKLETKKQLCGLS